MTQASLAPLLAAIRAVTTWLEASGVPSAVVGGVAASIHGRPRVTKDVDVVALVDLDECGTLVSKAAAFGIAPRILDAVDFSRTSRVLLLRHDASGVELDVTLGALPFEHELVARSRSVTVRDVQFPLARPEDILIMKAIAMRPRDIADIAAIVEETPDLDLDRVRSTVEQFSTMLEEGDMLVELDRILSKIPSRS